MKQYKIQLLTGGGFCKEFKVKADQLIADELGFYRFIIENETIAYFPINRTTILEIKKL